MSVIEQLKDNNINPDMLKTQIRFAVELIEPSLTAVDANGNIVLNNEKVYKFCKAIAILVAPPSKVIEDVAAHNKETLQLLFDAAAAILVGVYAHMCHMGKDWEVEMIDNFMEWTLKEERRRNAE